ncbi:MAG: hypothetical protein E7591_08080 [Ruminococcaceae bacterium]|nr:hypothetical protein [Oscillospiraceae bacterium]
MQKDVVLLQEEKLESLADMFIDALDESRAKVKKTTKKEAAEASKNNGRAIETINIKNQLNIAEDYAKIVDNIETISDDDAEYNKEYHTFVKISDSTPSIICEKCEVPDLSMIIRYDTLYLETRREGVFPGHYHHLGTEVMRDIYDIISNPDMILKQNNERFVVIAYDSRVKGSETMISLEINSMKSIDNKYSNYNIVVTAFDLKKRYFKNLLSKKGAEIKYKKEDLEQVNPQLHEWLGIVNSQSSNNMISKTNENVNTSSNISDEDVGNQIKINGQDLAHIDDNEELKAIVVDMIEQKRRTTKSRRNILSKDVRPFAKRYLL